MYYQVSKEFFDKLPNACFGAVAVRGLDNTHDIPELEKMLAGNVAECEAYFTGKKPKETEDILPYRAAFTALGINPNKFMCSIEALLTRIAKGKGFPHINAAVDLGNAVSIKHRLPMGAHDLDTIADGLDVRLADEGDTFIPFGSTEEEAPDAGEAVYACGHEIRTRRWTWRQSERGKITENTKAILFPIDGFRRECGGGTGGGGRTGGAAEKVFRRGAGDRDRHRNEGAAAVRILQISKKETPMGVSFFAYLSASAAARRARRKERTTASPLTPGRRATPSSRQQGGSMARTVRSWRA